jgi:NitT/TauT family transport system substrate-binding protein
MPFCFGKPSRPRRVGFLGSRSLLPVVLVAALLGACGGPSAPAAQPAAPAPAAKPAGGSAGQQAAAQPTQPPAPVTINLSFPSRSAPQVLPLIAQEEGFLPRQGIELDSTFFQGGPPALQAMMAGAADITSQITGTTINAIANGADIAIIMGLQADPDYQLYARAEISSVQALDGKKVAAADPGSELNTLVRKTLSYYGLPPDRYDLLPIGATNNRYAALTQGAVDATLLSVPLTFDAQARGMTYLGTTSDAVPNYMFTTVATKRDWGRQHADALVRLIRGYQDFLTWMQDPASKAKMVEYWVKLSGASEEAARQTYDTYVTGPLKNKVIAPDAGVDRNGVQAVIDIMLESDILKRPLTVDEVVDLSYWERASQR